MNHGLTRQWRRWRRPSRPTRGEQGVIEIVMLMMLVGVTLVAVAATYATGQLEFSNDSGNSNQSLEAAQAGIDVVLGHLRAANDGTVADNGVLAALPCGSAATFTGSVNDSSSATYTATVSYYASDPTGGGVPAITTCPLTAAPAYALVSSKASEPGAPSSLSRTLQTTYVFSTTDANIPGGLISNLTQNVCMDVANPVVGSPLLAAACVAGSANEHFAYQSNYTLVLTDTQSATSLGLCLTAVSPPLEIAGTAVTLQNCAATPPETQQWGVDDYADFAAVGAGGNPLSPSLCLNVTGSPTSPPTATYAILLATCNGAFTSSETWYPAATVGAGGAGAGTGQFVNYNEFGRCMDVTDFAVTTTYLIDYSCKQFPDTTNYPAWNQRFTYQKVGSGASAFYELQTTTGGTTYCLRSPLTTNQTWTGGSQSLGYGGPANAPTLEVCPGLSSPNLAAVTWTVYGANSDPDTSYTVQDADGYCLEANTATQVVPPSNTDAFSVIEMLPCSGSLTQKWNAPPTLISYPTKNTNEP